MLDALLRIVRGLIIARCFSAAEQRVKRLGFEKAQEHQGRRQRQDRFDITLENFEKAAWKAWLTVYYLRSNRL
jgi:hypothetical protein